MIFIIRILIAVMLLSGIAMADPASDSCDEQFPGDVNNDGSITLDDAIYLADYIKGVVAPPPILANTDDNGDCVTDINDSE